MSAARTAAAILMLTSLMVSCRTAGNGQAERERLVFWPGAWTSHDYLGGAVEEATLALTLGDDRRRDREVKITLCYEHVGRAMRVRKLTMSEGGYGHPTVEREVISASDIERVASILCAAAQTDVYRYYERGEQHVIDEFSEFCYKPPPADNPEEAGKAWRFFSEKFLRYLRLADDTARPETIRATAKEMLEIVEAELGGGARR